MSGGNLVIIMSMTTWMSRDMSMDMSMSMSRGYESVEWDDSLSRCAQLPFQGRSMGLSLRGKSGWNEYEYELMRCGRV